MCDRPSQRRVRLVECFEGDPASFWDSAHDPVDEVPGDFPWIVPPPKRWRKRDRRLVLGNA